MSGARRRLVRARKLCSRLTSAYAARSRSATIASKAALVRRATRAIEWLRPRFFQAWSRCRATSATFVRTVRNSDARAKRNIGAAVATVLTVATLSLVWYPGDTWAGTVPSSAQSVGSCHVLQIRSEKLNFSDVRPPVPCTAPHQAETILTGELEGELAAADTRMSPERRLMVMPELCPESAVREYLGAGARDEAYGLGVLLRLPTAHEWEHGIRQYRCELVVEDPEDPLRIPTITGSLRDIMTTPESSRFRRCWTGFVEETTCDRPHRSESVSSIANAPDWVTAFGPPEQFTAEQYRQFQRWASKTCDATVKEFLGAPVQRTRYHARGHLTPDAGVLRCSVASPADQAPTTGSLAPERK